MAVWKPTLWSEGIGLSKSAKQAIPPSYVSIVESVDIQLMMDGMMVGPLRDVSNPTGCAYGDRFAQDSIHQRGRPANALERPAPTAQSPVSCDQSGRRRRRARLHQAGKGPLGTLAASASTFRAGTCSASWPIVLLPPLLLTSESLANHRGWLREQSGPEFRGLLAPLAGPRC